MEYILIAIFEIIGVGLHVAQKIALFRKAHPQHKFKEVFEGFWAEDWNTLLVSALVLFLNLFGHYAVINYAPGDFTSHPWYDMGSFGLALVLGYGGQRLIYKYLGTAENFLDKKVTEKLS
jgi:hypothetical protein